MTKRILNDCIEIVKDLVGNEYLYFDSALQVKVSPHTHPFQVWGVCVSPADAMYIMDSDEQWHKLELTDINAPLMVSSLYQRLGLMRRQYAKAS
jgi:hypothetical protein